MPERLIGTREAAEILHRDPRVVRRLIERGDLPAERIGRTWAMREADVRAVADLLRPMGRPRKDRPS